ncbi:MAG: 4-(cytidine 5'-diphospho)-2-C-methyl-D-erythritol kinase [Phycisphaeraceae bacterium]|nr:MAG: 4-(cytidine 5'-diphospho)-2-C-methyl-D-erythritol kinase [Phycisphaeraceae bacterium]
MPFPSLHRPVITRRAHAKVNLALAVGPASPDDGYHPIASWMARIDLADDLEITRLEDDYLSRYAILWRDDAPRKSEIDWSITQDLSVRAHLLLEETTGRPLPIQLKLSKRIPVGGGLAGGSADAAAMLLALDELFELRLTPENLTDLAMRLGSDVAYCLNHAPALVTGRGETITPTPHCPAHLVLIIPDFGCATGAVYRAFDDAPQPKFDPDRVAQLAHAADPAAKLFNHLAEPARAVQPRLAELIDTIEDDIARDLPVHVTGSGSTLFIVCPDGRREARQLAQDINAHLPNLAALHTTII